MKTKLIIYLSMLAMIITLSCDKNGKEYTAPCLTIISFDACGVNDIGNNLNWLNDIIETSRNDQTGRYLGRIWYKSHKNQDVIVTDMIFSAGESMYSVYNCSGQKIIIEDMALYSSLTEHDIIWTNMCFD